MVCAPPPMALRPPLKLLHAHAAATIFVVCDTVARTLRIYWLMGGVHGRLPVREAFVVTTFGDAASAVTPWRAGGEVVRLAGMKHSGVDYSRSLAVLAVETMVGYTMLAIAGALLAIAYGREIVGGAALPGINFLILCAALGGLVAGIAVFRARNHRTFPGAEKISAFFRNSWLHVRALSPGAIMTACALTIISLASRVAILPAIALVSGSMANAGALTLLSLILLYGQIAIPVPSGAGPIDYALLNSGDAIPDPALTLGMWRFYTVIIPALIGFTAGFLRYGKGVWRSMRQEA